MTTPKSMEVTPSKAAEWLNARPEHQRNINQEHVTNLAAAMSAGQWMENGETIKFDTDGKLLDGQHRLSAIVRSKTTQVMLVVRGVDPSAFATIDVGRRRTPGDMFTIGGRKGGPKLAALTRAMLVIERAHRRGYMLHEVRDPATVLLDYHAEHREELAWAIETYGSLRKFVRNPMVVAAALAYMRRFARDEVELFTMSLVDGSGLEPLSPILHLRNRLLEVPKGGSSAEHKRIAEVISMFSAWVRGAKLERMVPTALTGDGHQSLPVIFISSTHSVNADGSKMSGRSRPIEIVRSRSAAKASKR